MTMAMGLLHPMAAITDIRRHTEAIRGTDTEMTATMTMTAIRRMDTAMMTAMETVVRIAMRTVMTTDIPMEMAEAIMSRKKTERTRTDSTDRKRESTEGQGAGKKVRVREVQFDQESEVHEGKGRNTELGIVTYTFVFLFLMLAGYLIYLNVFKAKELNSNMYNTKQDANIDKYIRGPILSADGSVLAETRVGDDGSETRVYPYANTFAHVIGYATNGKAGLVS